MKWSRILWSPQCGQGPGEVGGGPGGPIELVHSFGLQEGVNAIGRVQPIGRVHAVGRLVIQAGLHLLSFISN